MNNSTFITRPCLDAHMLQERILVFKVFFKAHEMPSWKCRVRGRSGKRAVADLMEVQYTVSVRGRFFSRSQCSSHCRGGARCITNRDKNPSYLGSMHCCKGPLWGRRLDLDCLNLTRRFAHRFLLLLRVRHLEEQVVGRFSRTVPTHGAVQGLPDSRRWGLRQHRGHSWWVGGGLE